MVGEKKDYGGLPLAVVAPASDNYIYTISTFLRANKKQPQIFRVKLPLLRRGRGARSNARLNAQVKNCHPINSKKGTLLLLRRPRAPGYAPGYQYIFVIVITAINKYLCKLSGIHQFNFVC